MPFANSNLQSGIWMATSNPHSAGSKESSSPCITNDGAVIVHNKSIREPSAIMAASCRSGPSE
jgi:hypothetical protein